MFYLPHGDVTNSTTYIRQYSKYDCMELQNVLYSCHVSNSTMLKKNNVTSKHVCLLACIMPVTKLIVLHKVITQCSIRTCTILLLA